MNRTDIQAALGNANVQAFLRVIRAGETGQTDDAYRTMFGGGHFDGFADHPRRVITRGSLSSSAAGAYQFLSRTWDGLVKQYGFPDFSPACQDEGAVALIAGRKALPAVLAGRLHDAIALCNREWASLPGSPYGQPTMTPTKARDIYLAYGGTFQEVMPIDAPAPQPDPQPSPQPEPAKDTAMLPLIPLLGAILPTLAQNIPALGKLFGSGSEVNERNVKAASMAVDIVQQVVGASNAQQAAELVAADPALAKAANDALQARYFDLTEAGGGGIKGAREADAAFAASGRKSIESPAFIVSLVLLAMPFLLLIDVFYAHPGNYSGELRTQIVTGVLMVISMVGAFWLGSSFGSMKKTEAGAAGRDGAREAAQ